MRKEYDKLHLLKILCCVAEQHSFSRAAEQLGTTTSAVSKSIAQLESSYGQVLLNRTTRKLALSDAGKLVYEKGKKILRALRDLEEEVEQVGVHQSGHLKITFPNTIGRMLLSQICIDFQKRYPQIKLELMFTAANQDLIEDEIDVAFRLSAALKDSQFYVLKLININSTFVATPSYLAAHGKPEQLDELSRHNMLLSKLNHVEDSWYDGTRSYALQGNLIANSRFHIREAVLAGLGIAMLPSYFCQRDIDSGALVELFPEQNRPEVTLHAIYKVKREHSAKLDLFLGFVQAQLSCKSELVS
ncbi:LysR family transcriptional regulator [Pseudoalteromonas piscicida]|uniref:LysR family transcriptional regulator n=1 Tax=Pseudoalteromonas piscicida TaxID=43662 RepID=A0AAQ2ESK2_PSEO7|nr:MULTISPECIES: LysR family transcriptional regulator [Pseudoalteromonas]KJY90021.1 LysR family transcriptional regulator [Pseudoalteromonas piscicida]MDP4489513.1 LysR family transcriptional regulator [Pseudoalteromonas piscicida]TMN35043.1 LysR family transcriptional regulator [Pseudoalteromonas piscicida]TMN39244.1 LysR family transcriptional regulator [Pseudoalteromonas piscicida]TMN50414.1 LysR family transcriptional regulator [Pseudoalteromonas piscicida]